MGVLYHHGTARAPGAGFTCPGEGDEGVAGVGFIILHVIPSSTINRRLPLYDISYVAIDSDVFTVIATVMSIP